MKCPNISLNERCLKYFNHLTTDLTFYFLIIDKDTNFLYKIKYKNKKIQFLSESKQIGLLNQIKELFPKKSFEFKNYDYITIDLFTKHNKFVIGLDREFPIQVMWNGRGIYEI